MDELLETLKQLRRLAKDPKYDNFPPMVQVRQLARDALESARTLANTPGPLATQKQLVVIERPEVISNEARQALGDLVTAKLRSCNLPHEVLILDGATLHVLGIEGDDPQSTQPGRPDEETGDDSVPAGSPAGECVQ